MDATARELTGLVMAGGASLRMGADKMLLEVDGEPLVVRAARFLSGFCGGVVLAAAGREDLAARCEAAGVQVRGVDDARPDSGPLGGLVAGLRSAPTRWVAVVAADLLSPSRAVLVRCAQLAMAETPAGRGSSPPPVVLPEVGGRLEPLHAVWARDTVELLEARLYAGRLSVTGAAVDAGARVLTEAEWAAVEPRTDFTRNLNRPEDLPGGATSR